MSLPCHAHCQGNTSRNSETFGRAFWVQTGCAHELEQYGTSQVTWPLLHRLQGSSLAFSTVASPMLLSTAVQRSLAAAGSSAVSTLTTSEKEAGRSRSRLPVLSLTIVLLSGLVASRPWIGVAPDSSSSGLSPSGAGSLGRSPGSLQGLAYNLTEPAVQLCRSYCLSRDAPVEHCYKQCLAHPEVLRFIPALEASAAAAPGPQRTLLFAAWYAEGERGSEVCSSSCCSLLSATPACMTGQPHRDGLFHSQAPVWGHATGCPAAWKAMYVAALHAHQSPSAVVCPVLHVAAPLVSRA